MSEQKPEIGDQLPPCPKCGKVDLYLTRYHTHDLDHIFGIA